MNKVFVVDDDAAVRDSLALLLETADFNVESFASAEAFLRDYKPTPPECLLLDLSMPAMSGLELQQELERRKVQIPVIFLSAHGDIPASVQAIKGGALDFLTKPVEPAHLLERVQSAFLKSRADQRALTTASQAHERLVGLSERERQVMELALKGLQNKDIARQCGISHRTVEIHRARVLRKTGATNLLELARLADRTRP